MNKSVHLSVPDVPLERDVYLRASATELSGVVGGVAGFGEASGFVGVAERDADAAGCVCVRM